MLTKKIWPKYAVYADLCRKQSSFLSLIFQIKDSFSFTIESQAKCTSDLALRSSIYFIKYQVCQMTEFSLIINLLRVFNRNKKSANVMISSWRHGRKKWTEQKITPGGKLRKAKQGSTMKSSFQKFENKENNKKDFSGKQFDV